MLQDAIYNRKDVCFQTTLVVYNITSVRIGQKDSGEIRLVWLTGWPFLGSLLHAETLKPSRPTNTSAQIPHLCVFFQGDTTNISHSLQTLCCALKTLNKLAIGVGTAHDYSESLKMYISHPQQGSGLVISNVALVLEGQARPSKASVQELDLMLSRGP